MGYRDYSTAKGHIVDATNHGDFATIQAAITAASSGQTIFIRPGTYTENLTLKVGVNLTAYVCDADTPTVTIVGKCTLSTAGAVSVSGINFQTNSDFAIAVTGTVASVLNIDNCNINCSNNTGISFTAANASANINVVGTTGDLGTTGIAIYAMTSTGVLDMRDCNFSNTGGSTTASTNSGASVRLGTSFFDSAFSTSSTGGLSAYYTQFDCSLINTTCLTLNGTGAEFTIDHCELFSGTASALSIGTSVAASVFLCDVRSSNTNAITGAGTLNYGGITFSGSSSTINTSVQNPVPWPVKQGGTGVSTLTGLALGSGTAAFTAVSYTAATAWTPVLQFGGATTGITYAVQRGSYQQIGNVVFFRFFISLSSKGSATGVATITGFPVAFGDYIDWPIIGETVTLSVTNLEMFMQAQSGATNVLLQQITIGGAITSITNTNFANTSQILFSASYLV